MGYLALYRKYRPSGFDGVIGQDHIIQTLVNQIKYNRLGHAYLFTGTRGTGKTSIAKIFAKAINCETPVNGSPCGKCPTCLSLADPSNIDVIEIDAASNNGVNEIRDIRENVQFPPVTCKYKVYIVDEVHMLSGAAFNALLKTLEEPPKHAIFILATTEVHKIPATILSRCMRFDFRLVDTEMIANLIASVYDKEGKKYEKEAVFAIAKAGEGSVRDALSIADIAMSINNEVLTYNDVLNVLGASDNQLILKLLTFIFNGKTGELLQTVNDLCSLGKSIGVLIKDLTSVIRELVIIKTCKESNKILGLPNDIFQDMKNIVENVDVERMLRALEIFSETSTSLRYSNHPRIIFETALLKVCKPQNDMDLTSLMSRINALENKSSQQVIKVVEVKENIEQVKQSPIVENVNEKKDLNRYSSSEIKGFLLTGLRRIKSEMLWNVIQTTNVEVNGRIITVVAKDEYDFDLLEKPENKEKLKKALDDFENVEILTELSKKKVEMNEIDDATDKIKQIFGDDIVIVND